MNKQLTFLPLDANDNRLMEEMAARLGYGSNVTYNTNCDLPGLYCLADRRGQETGMIVKTKEFGFLFIQDLGDLGFNDLDEKARKSEF